MEKAKWFTILVFYLSWSDAVIITNMQYARVKEGLCPTYVITTRATTKISCAEICFQADLLCVGFCYSKSKAECYLYTIANVPGSTNFLYPYFGYTFIYAAEVRATAASSCRSFGSYLSLPQNMQENQFLNTLPVNLGYSYQVISLGANDGAQAFLFVNDIDGHQITFTNWDSGLPDNYNGNERCATMLTNGKWNDAPCWYGYTYICQSPAFGCPNAPKGTNGENPGETCYMKITS